MQLNKGYIDYVYCTYAFGYQYGAPNRRRQAGANAGEETDRWIDEQQGALYCVHVCRVAAAHA